MSELLAKNIMTKKVITINKNASVEKLSELLLKNKISGVPVVDDDGKLVGVATEGDLIVKDSDLHFPRYFKLLDSIIYLESLNKFKSNLKKYLGTKVEDIMTAKVITVRENTLVSEVANIMIRNNVNRVPVLNSKGDLAGIITRADIVKSMV
ncbi:MAG: CBS domain-containing protein [Actinomycetota bacterium]|jgi:CBS domain-containing protein|nr:CBS domain-containing protein [Actinomycetota bacterium]